MLQDLIVVAEGWTLETLETDDDRIVEAVELEHQSGTILRIARYRSGLLQAAACRPDGLPSLSKGAFEKSLKAVIPSRNWEPVQGHPFNKISRP